MAAKLDQFGLLYNHFMNNQQLALKAQTTDQQKKQTAQTQKQLRPKVEQSSHSGSNEGDLTKPLEAKEQAKIVIAQDKIFAKRASIFTEKPHLQLNGNIFANRKSVNLFNINPKQSNQTVFNIFTLANSSQQNANTEEQNNLFSENNEGPEDTVAEQTQQKVMRYTYQDRMEKIGDFRITKFKNGRDLTKEGPMILSLEKQKQVKNNIIHLVLRAQATKITIYQSALLQNTKVQHFQKRDQNIKLWAISSKKKESASIPEREQVKIQFENVEQAKRFEQIFEAKSQTKAQ